LDLGNDGSCAINLRPARSEWFIVVPVPVQNVNVNVNWFLVIADITDSTDSYNALWGGLEWEVLIGPA
jgi:hypothetical protein